MTAEEQANVKQAVPFFSVSDMTASFDFYVDGLGFEIVNKWIKDDKIRWCMLQLGKASIMLQEFATEGTNSWVPEGKMGEGISIYFFCEDALEIYLEIIARGIDAKKPFVGNGMWVTSMKDPDGFKLFFESDTDVAEGTEYSEKYA